MRSRTTGRAVIAAALAGVLAALMSCTPVRQVTPLEPGQSAVHVSLGGHLTNYVGDIQLPLPLLGIGYNRGMLPWLDIEGGIDVTHLLYKNLSMDLGANLRPISTRRWRPALIVSPRAHLATDFDFYFRFYPVLSLTGAWNPREGAFHPYLGLESWWELVNERDDGNEQEHHWIVAPYVGLALVRRKWQYQIECRWYAPNIDNDYGRAPSNFGPGDQGILGFYLGIGRTFGKKAEQ